MVTGSWRDLKQKEEQETTELQCVAASRFGGERELERRKTRDREAVEGRHPEGAFPQSI